MRRPSGLLLLSALVLTGLGWAQANATGPDAGNETRIPVQSQQGQKPPGDTDQAGYLPRGSDPENRLWSPFFKHLAADQAQFWSSPKELRKPEAWKTFGPFLGLTGGLIAGDSWISKQVPDSPSQLKRSKNISDFGAYSLVGLAGGSYLWGHVTHNDHLREAGFLSGEAALNSTGVAYLLKGITQRPRPQEADHNGTFFQGGMSFPSEHAAVAWSVASVFAHEYPGPFTQIAAYGLASAVTLTRVTAKQHFSSDVVVGSALGWYLGRQIYRAHHDPELGGAPWGNLIESTNATPKPRNPQHMGSPYVPLDSWVYPALDRLAGMGVVNSLFAGLKPWTRLECARLTEEAEEALGQEGDEPSDLSALQARLREEFAYEFGLLDGGRNATAALDSAYARVNSVSGPALTDGFHFGQTVSYDFGRPFGRGTSGQVGGAPWFAAGPLVGYIRAEYQHAPSIPAPSDAVRALIAERDQVPPPPATPRETINRARLVDAYIALNLGNWQISAGRQNLSWGPGLGGSLLWSDNAEPIDMVQMTNPKPFRLPLFLRYLGPARLDLFLGRIGGTTWIVRPFIYGQKINFKPISSLEFGFGRTLTIGSGGGNGDPFTFGNFFNGYLGRVITPPGPPGQVPSVPGDDHVGMDWTFRIPKVRNYIVFYGELYADDDPLPILNPPKNPYRPGIYITRIPGIPKLDFHMEAASTESPGFGKGEVPNQGNLNYWNFKYRDGYITNGNLIGNTVGRNGRAIQCWFSYWLSSRNTVQFAYKHSTVGSDFIPGGGAWQDFAVKNEVYLRSGLYWKSQVQYEHISRYPLLFHGAQKNVAALVEFGFTLRDKK